MIQFFMFKLHFFGWGAGGCMSPTPQIWELRIVEEGRVYKIWDLCTYCMSTCLNYLSTYIDTLYSVFEEIRQNFKELLLPSNLTKQNKGIL